ncbi:CheY-like protein [Lizonia empirigonia]|nr:CheY-like protein [Lizonia empirigonia]
MNMFKPEVQAKNIQFTFHPDHSVETLNIDWVLLDPSRLLQITVNLITNAIKFTQAEPERAISVHVSASSAEPDTYGTGFTFVPTRGVPLFDITAGEEWGPGELIYLHVEVQDTGCDSVFISRQLAELHGGQIGVSSQAGVGSTFGFFIQCKRTVSSSRPVMNRTITSQSTDHVEKNRGLAASVSGMETKTPTPKEILAEVPKAVTPKATAPEQSPLHILIVEDNIVNQKVLAKQLRKAGCVVSTADNGLFALTELKKTVYYTPDGIPLSIILMDWEMPEMNGLECAREIRRMQADGEIERHVPIIAVTANVRREQIATARESGMDDVMSKPFRVPELLVKVKDLLKSLAVLHEETLATQLDI